MEQQETKKKSNVSKTLIICGTTVLIAAIALVCVLVITGGGNKGESMPDGAMFMGEEMSFEEFCVGMKEDLPPETMEEVKSLYEDAKQAMEAGDMDKLDEVYAKLDSLDVFDYSNMDLESMNMMEGGAFIDENGNVMDELPEGAEIIEWENE